MGASSSSQPQDAARYKEQVSITQMNLSKKTQTFCRKTTGARVASQQDKTSSVLTGRPAIHSFQGHAQPIPSPNSQCKPTHPPRWFLRINDLDRANPPHQVHRSRNSVQGLCPPHRVPGGFLGFWVSAWVRACVRACMKKDGLGSALFLMSV